MANTTLCGMKSAGSVRLRRETSAMKRSRTSAGPPRDSRRRQARTLFLAFTILRTTATESATQAALAHNTRLAEAAVAAGGTVYSISAVPS